MTQTYEAFQIFSGIALGFELAIILAGLAITLRYRRQSAWMILIALGFAGKCAQAGLSLSLTIAGNWITTSIGGTIDLLLGLYTVIELASIAAWIAIVAGLAMVWKDIRQQFARQREIYEERRPDLPYPGGAL